MKTNNITSNNKQEVNFKFKNFLTFFIISIWPLFVEI